jgi:hypothetical protein
MLKTSHVVSDDALHLSRDSRVVALRWDLVPWGIVLDLDVPISEAKGAAMRRAWLLFSGVAEVTIPMQSSRLPTGIWLTSSFAVEGSAQESLLYTCRALLPEFNENRLREDGTLGCISIRAQSLVGVVSQRSSLASEYGLSLGSRTDLASDQEMLASLDA